MYKTDGSGRIATSKALAGTRVGVGLGTGVTLANGITKGGVGVRVLVRDSGKEVASVAVGKPLVGDDGKKFGSGVGVGQLVGVGTEIGAAVGCLVGVRTRVGTV